MKHSKTSRRWPYLAVAAALSLGTIGLTGQVEAASANPTPVCSNGLCTVTFDYTGDVYVYAPPSGIRTLSFELAGAQGGRSGGLGGKVAGTFSTIPASMNIYVGGAGKQGSLAAGGYNGGGAAGGSHGDEGSGGGSSDIRLSAALDDRIVVAGGGGGTGGWIGQAGASGGGLIASTGAGVAPAGGGGGSQLAGGTAGAGASASAGTAGAKGVGGAGGSGSIGGGGGGGGGYFGGGGGGGDGVPSGVDGAGGGGGSSFASSNYTKSVVHSAGVRTGNGQVILTYAYAPTVTTFTAISSSGTQSAVPFNLVFNQSIAGLEPADFGFVGTAGGCVVSSITGSGTSYTVTVTGCSDGTLALTLNADSVLGATNGPVTSATTTQLTLDRKNPTLTITSPVSPSNLTSLPFQISADEPVSGLQSSSFSVQGSGCQVGAVTGSGQSFSVAVNSCASAANVVLTLKTSTVQDAAGNAGPLSQVVSSAVLTDFDVPTPATFTTDPSSHPGLLGFNLTFSEPVTGLQASSFDIHGTGCSISKLSGTGASYSIWLTDCAQGVSAYLTLKANAVVDAAANQGPIVSIDSTAVTIDDLAPSATITSVTRTNQTSQPAWDIVFTEPVQGFSANSISYAGSATGCSFTLATTLTGLSYRVTASSCTSGTIRLQLPPRVVQDATSNLGPASLIAAEQVVIDRTQSQVTPFIASVKPKTFKVDQKPKTANTKPSVVVEEPVVQRPQPKIQTVARVLPAVAPKQESSDPPFGILALTGSVLLGGAWVFWRRRGF